MDDESDRAAILKRRARLVAATMASLMGATIAASGCETEVVVQEGGNGGSGGSGASGAGGEGAAPQACLGAPLGGMGGAGGGDDGSGGRPQVCLEAPIGGRDSK